MNKFIDFTIDETYFAVLALPVESGEPHLFQVTEASPNESGVDYTNYILNAKELKSMFKGDENLRNIEHAVGGWESNFHSTELSLPEFVTDLSLFSSRFLEEDDAILWAAKIKMEIFNASDKIISKTELLW